MAQERVVDVSSKFQEHRELEQGCVLGRKEKSKGKTQFLPPSVQGRNEFFPTVFLFPMSLLYYAPKTLDP